MSNTIEQFANQVAEGLAQTGTARTAPGLYRPLLLLLARGRPVTIADLAAAAGREELEVARMVADWHDTEFDEEGRIIGYGLTQRPTPHRFTVDGHRLYTWCALDTLVFPTVLDRPAEVESACRATGAPVRLTVDPADGVTGVEPATTVVSIVTVEDGCDSVRAAFCDEVHFFVDADAAGPWVANHPGMTVLPVAEAYRLGQPLIDAVLDGSGPAGCSPQ